MRCHVCNAEVGQDQRFCHQCGASLEGVTDPTEPLDMEAVLAAGGDDAPEDAEGPEAGEVAVAMAAGAPLATAATASLAPPAGDPAADPAFAAPPEPATTPMQVVPPPPPPTDALDLDDVAWADTTEVHPPVFDDEIGPGLLPERPEPVRFRLNVVLGLLAAVTAALCAFADITDVRTDRVVPGIENRLRTIDDLGSNLAIASFIGAAALLVGGVVHCFNRRWGAGLAGGAGLALAGWAGVTIGLAEVPISIAERITRDPSTPGPFTLTITRDLGYWLIVALGVIGLVAFVLSLLSAGTGGRPVPDPWSAAVGALGGVVAAAGPLIPVGNATFSSNFGVNDLPAAFFAGRLVQVGLLGLAAMVGFLLVRRYGLGLVAGGLTVPTFMWLTTLIGVGEAPIGLGVGNLGSADVTPHAVTTAGMVTALVMLLVASTVAAVKRPR